MEPAIQEPAAPHETGRKDAPTVSFEHVTFAYPRRGGSGYPGSELPMPRGGDHRRHRGHRGGEEHRG